MLEIGGAIRADENIEVGAVRRISQGGSRMWRRQLRGGGSNIGVWVGTRSERQARFFNDLLEGALGG